MSSQIQTHIISKSHLIWKQAQQFKENKKQKEKGKPMLLGNDDCASAVNSTYVFCHPSITEIAFITANKGTGYSAAVKISQIRTLKDENRKTVIQTTFSRSCTIEQLFSKKLNWFESCFNNGGKKHHKINSS